MTAASASAIRNTHLSRAEQDHIPVMRGQWFIDGSWLPLEEEESDLIEQEHLNHFRGQQIQDTFETDLIVKTVDSKDGEGGRGCVLHL